jgi:hypothetical protein
MKPTQFSMALCYVHNGRLKIHDPAMPDCEVHHRDTSFTGMPWRLEFYQLFLLRFDATVCRMGDAEAGASPPETGICHLPAGRADST